MEVIITVGGILVVVGLFTYGVLSMAKYFDRDKDKKSKKGK